MTEGPTMKEAAEKVENEKLREELMEMGKRDQAVRIAWEKASQAGVTEEEMQNIFKEWGNVDAHNVSRIREIITQVGFPTKTMVGKDASHSA